MLGCPPGAVWGTVVNWLFTGCALLILAGCVVCVVLAYRARNECDETEHALRRALGRIAGLEAELAVLVAQVQKLRGKLYRLKQDPQEETANEIAKPFAQGIACENYLRAQTEGPSSSAAQCACDYCNAKRAERDALRTKFVPKNHGERRDAIERGKH